MSTKAELEAKKCRVSYTVDGPGGTFIVEQAVVPDCERNGFELVWIVREDDGRLRDVLTEKYMMEDALSYAFGAALPEKEG